MENENYLVSTITGQRYPFDRIAEFAENGEALEVASGRKDETVKRKDEPVRGKTGAMIRPGKHLWERFADFLPLRFQDESISLGEGNTPLVKADHKLLDFAGLNRLLLKNETLNPTWSFKDRGSLACMAMANEMNEEVVATISTGNMGHSIAAYAAKAGKRAIVFVPWFAPKEKILPMGIHGAVIMKISGPDYSDIKKHILQLAESLPLRIVSGNGPIRVEGYKMTAFELYEQMEGTVPDYIAVPTSACGHIRGVFKGYKELLQAGLIRSLPKMIVVQARNNSPIVTAIKQGCKQIVPFTNVQTIAEAITTGNPMGGDEIIDKAGRYGWLAEDVTEQEILQSQKILAESGYFVEPSSATSLFAIKKLREAGKLEKDATVVMMLTGSGLKDASVLSHHDACTIEIGVTEVEKKVSELMGS